MFRHCFSLLAWFLWLTWLVNTQLTEIQYLNTVIWKCSLTSCESFSVISSPSGFCFLPSVYLRWWRYKWHEIQAHNRDDDPHSSAHCGILQATTRFRHSSTRRPDYSAQGTQSSTWQWWIDEQISCRKTTYFYENWETSWLKSLWTPRNQEYLDNGIKRNLVEIEPRNLHCRWTMELFGTAAYLWGKVNQNLMMVLSVTM